MANVIVPKIFKELFIPNHTEQEKKKFTPQYKAEIRRRLLRGEEISDSEIGVKTFVLKGGRISGKTANDELATIPLFFDKEPGDIWCCRSEDNTIRNSIFQSVQSTLRKQGYTLSNRSDTDFKVCTAPFSIICNSTGNTMQFFAINKDIDRTKGRFPPSGKLKKVMLEESNEPDDPKFVEALRSTALRFMDENGKIVYRYNPPPSMNAWANRYYPNLEKRGARVIHSTWEDIAQLLDPVVIQDILRMKAEDPVRYSYLYGGEVVSLEGLVLYTFKKERNLVSLQQFQNQVAYGHYSVLYVIYGVDSGVVRDATAVCAWGVMSDGTLLKLETFYLDPKESREPIPNTMQVAEIRRWYKEFYARMNSYGVLMPGAYNECWVFDSAVVTQDLMIEFRNSTGFFCLAVENKNIDRDIKRLQNGYFRGIFKVLDVPENAESIRETTTFCYDENNEIPDGQDDHTIDADKYATAHYYYGYLSVMG